MWRTSNYRLHRWSERPEGVEISQPEAKSTSGGKLCGSTGIRCVSPPVGHCVLLNDQQTSRIDLTRLEFHFSFK
jgi:hypothetical protein